MVNPLKALVYLAAEKGDHGFIYSLVAGEYWIAQIAAEALIENSPLEAVSAKIGSEPTSLIKMVPGEFLIMKLWRETDGCICLRGYYMGDNPSDCDIVLNQCVNRVSKMNLLGKTLEDVDVQGQTVHMHVRPLLRIER